MHIGMQIVVVLAGGTMGRTTIFFVRYSTVIRYFMLLFVVCYCDCEIEKYIIWETPLNFTLRN